MRFNSGNLHYNQWSWTFSSLQWFSCIHTSQSVSSPHLWVRHWSTFYHFRLNLSSLEFHIKKWPLSLTIKFLFSLKSQFRYHCETFPDLLWLSSLVYFVHSLLYCTCLCNLLNPMLLEGRDMFSRFIIEPGTY